MILHSKGEVQTGTSRAGNPWAKREAVFKEPDNERYVAITLFGEDEVGVLDDIKEGSRVDVEYYVQSREWNGRWYTDVRFVSVDGDLPF